MGTAQTLNSAAQSLDVMILVCECEFVYEIFPEQRISAVGCGSLLQIAHLSAITSSGCWRFKELLMDDQTSPDDQPLWLEPSCWFLHQPFQDRSFSSRHLPFYSERISSFHLLPSN
ncbi:hypothetical protein ATANTOWER_016287 [Ataeniobius toweri]|uniref:Uncharacterized protein n=1 Tax=Ataeniobius toweri TaxID=208326 RepID=A0ABU7A2H6_9TELE|nr:hypothetical protein [Ataeniobius toweri]